MNKTFLCKNKELCFETSNQKICFSIIPNDFSVSDCTLSCISKAASNEYNTHFSESACINNCVSESEKYYGEKDKVCNSSSN